MAEIAANAAAASESLLKGRILATARLAVAGAMLLGSVGYIAARYQAGAPADAVSMAGLSDRAVASLLRGGKTIALLPAGSGSEAALGVAGKLGNAVVAPAAASRTDLAASLEQAARALKDKGFRGIAFLGTGGEARRAQAQVAEKLKREWAGTRMRVLDAGECCAGDAAADAKASLIKRVMTRIDA
ncbi:MAG: hypothetical protein L6R19_22580 [Alphaproteobacteria bacterium]|nr:hypothetical protein [Alphaproteobacteria bacterium]